MLVLAPRLPFRNLLIDEKNWVMIIEIFCANFGVFLSLKLTHGLTPLLLLGNKKMPIILVMISGVLKLIGPNGQRRMLEIMDRLSLESSVKSPGEGFPLTLSRSVVVKIPRLIMVKLLFGILTWESIFQKPADQDVGMFCQGS